MNWRDLKPDNLVRVTFEMPVRRVAENYLTLGGDDIDVKLVVDEKPADAAKWELLPKPLKIGRAKHWPSGHSCQVLAIHEGLAWIVFDLSGDYATRSVCHLENIDEEPQP